MLNFRKRIILSVSLLFIAAGQAVGRQADSVAVILERDLEQATENLDPDDPDSDPESFLVYLQELAANPVNINRARMDDLLLIPGMNFRYASAIITYRNDHAPFESIEDLTEVPGLDGTVVRSMLPYLTIGSRREQRRDLYFNKRFWLNDPKSEFISRYRTVIQKQDGYIRPDSLGGFTGSPVHYYQRFRFSTSKLSLNVTQEKDPGEKLSGIRSFDYTSWHVAVQKTGMLQRVVIGDYSLSFGQGLLFWTGGSFGKSRDVVRSVSKNERGIRPYGSAGEASGFRGIAFTLGNRFQLTGFYSHRKRTATERDSLTIRFPVTSGYHRTLNEQHRKNNVSQTTAGGRLRYQSDIAHAGVTGYINTFSRFVEPGDLPYQRHRFSGRKLSGFSADGGILLRNVYFFAEGAVTSQGGTGLIAGAEKSLGPSTDAVLLYRRYDPALQTLFGGSFAEQSSYPSNEHGFYTGVSHSFGTLLKIRAYADIFRFPAPRFLTSRPTSGTDYLFQIEVNPHRKLHFYLLARSKTRESEFSSSDPFGREIKVPGNQSRQSIRIQAEWSPFNFIRTRTRIEQMNAETPEGTVSRGVLFFQDLRLIPDPRVKLDLRVTLFRTEDYESRVYQFENDLLYVMSNTMLYGNGIRYYALLQVKTFSRLDLYAKLSTTVYSDRTEISSGNLRIPGNRRSDAGIQVRFRI